MHERVSVRLLQWLALCALCLAAPHAALFAQLVPKDLPPLEKPRSGNEELHNRLQDLRKQCVPIDEDKRFSDSTALHPLNPFGEVGIDFQDEALKIFDEGGSPCETWARLNILMDAQVGVRYSELVVEPINVFLVPDAATLAEKIAPVLSLPYQIYDSIDDIKGYVEFWDNFFTSHRSQAQHMEALEYFKKSAAWDAATVEEKRDQITKAVQRRWKAHAQVYEELERKLEPYLNACKKDSPTGSPYHQKLGGMPVEGIPSCDTYFNKQASEFRYHRAVAHGILTEIDGLLLKRTVLEKYRTPMLETDCARQQEIWKKNNRCPGQKQAAIKAAHKAAVEAGTKPLPGSGPSLSISGSFEEKGAAQACDPHVTAGPVDVPFAGMLRITGRADPQVPQRWSLHNSPTGLTVIYEPRLGNGWGAGTHLFNQGLAPGNGTEAQARIPGPGRLTMVLSPPGGAGPLTGSCFEQTASAEAQYYVLDTTRDAVAGETLNVGDTLIVREGGHMFVRFPDSGQALFDKEATVKLQGTGEDDERARLDLQRGRARVRSDNGEPAAEIKSGSWVITPDHTDYSVTREGDSTVVRVYEGVVTARGPNGERLTIKAGEEVALSTGTKVMFDPATDDSPLVNGEPMREALVDDDVPEPYGSYPAADKAETNRPGSGWIFKDPGADAVLENLAPETLKLTVPDGNDFWAGRNDAPRLLHKATGDFDLELNCNLASEGRHLATLEFILHSPGSHIGLLQGQMRPDSPDRDTLILGGWVMVENKNKLATFMRPPATCLDGPEAPGVMVRMRLVRRGNQFKGYVSRDDGRTWHLAFRKVLDLPETIWPGLVAKRMAYDNLRDKPAVCTLTGLKLTTSPRWSMPLEAWDMAAPQGELLHQGNEFLFTLNSDTPAGQYALTAQSLTGDFDVVLRGEVLGRDASPGHGHHWGLSAIDPDNLKNGFEVQNQMYINAASHGPRHGARFASDKCVSGRWGPYRYDQLPPETAAKQLELTWLRLTRRKGRLSTAYWRDGQWVELGNHGDEALQMPLHLLLFAGNDWEAADSAELRVKLVVERAVIGDIPETPYIPKGYALLAPIPLPGGVKAPEGMEARAFLAPFDLGHVAFGPDGSVHVLSNAKDRGVLVQLDMAGTSRVRLASEAFLGINLKRFMFLENSILLSVDGWRDGGSALSGLYEVDEFGVFEQWKLVQGHGGLSGITSAPAGGWLLSDFESDGLWHLPGKDEEERQLVTSGAMPKGLSQVEADPGTRRVFALNWTGGWPFGGDPGVLELRDDGSLLLTLGCDDSGQGKNCGGLALVPEALREGLLPPGLYVTRSGAKDLLRKAWTGEVQVVATGLHAPGAVAIREDARALAVVYDARRLLLFSPESQPDSPFASKTRYSTDVKETEKPTVNHNGSSPPGKVSSGSIYKAVVKGDVFQGGLWVGSRNKQDWIQRDFETPADIAEIYIGRASTDVTTEGFRIVINLQKENGQWLIVDELKNTNINRTQLSFGNIGKSIPFYRKKFSPPLRAKAFRLEMFGHGWFDAQDIRLISGGHTDAAIPSSGDHASQTSKRSGKIFTVQVSSDRNIIGDPAFDRNVQGNRNIHVVDRNQSRSRLELTFSDSRMSNARPRKASLILNVPSIKDAESGHGFLVYQGNVLVGRSGRIDGGSQIAIGLDPSGLKLSDTVSLTIKGASDDGSYIMSKASGQGPTLKIEQ